MKTSIFIGGIVACTLSAPIVSAQGVSAPASPAMSMDMDRHMTRMQENMTKMQNQMDRLRKTTDAAERQKLMREHMQAMQENMKTMRGMGGPMLTGSGQRGGMAMGGQKDMAGGDVMQRQEMMEKRMDTMQMMMEQMLQHDQAMETMPAK